MSETTNTDDANVDEIGEYRVNGVTVPLRRHPTDFTVQTTNLPALQNYANVSSVVSLNRFIARAVATDASSRDDAMAAVRTDAVAHHIYQRAETDEELVIDDRILVTLDREDPVLIERLIQQFQLQSAGRLGDAYILRVTDASGMNPLKIAAQILAVPGVRDATAHTLAPLVPHGAVPRLFGRQWYLSSDQVVSPDVLPNSGIRVPEAWQVTTGSPDIVVAIIDDGFDLGHPAFMGKQISPFRYDFALGGMDDNPLPEGDNYHGTCVASIATASAIGGGMIGVAPGCTLLPIRIGFGTFAGQIDIFTIFKYVSLHADIANCSFGYPPASVPLLSDAFRNAVTDLTRSGGRRGKGLVMVFSAANDDAPTSLTGPENINGVLYFDFGSGIARTIPAGMPVFSGYASIEGVVVVASVTSRKRKAGYSNWGKEIDLCAPSNNDHFLRFSSDLAIRQRFTANYRGLGQVAASNRPGVAQAFDPLADDPTTPDFPENFYTVSFGGTSGAAPVVSGTSALVLSANPSLTAAQVKQILIATADTDLDPITDLANDPNLQGNTGAFINGHSLFFGAGKIDAARAVQRAAALAAGPLAPPATGLIIPSTAVLLPAIAEVTPEMAPVLAAPPGVKTVQATVTCGASIQQAVIGIDAQPPVILIGSATQKSATVFTDPFGILNFTLIVQTQLPGTVFTCTLTEAGASQPTFSQTGTTQTDSHGRATGMVGSLVAF